MLLSFTENDPEGQTFVAAFREELQKLGWTDGRNIRIDTRWATPGDGGLGQRLAKELVALQPELILSQNTPTTDVLLQQTRTIPIIFTAVSDPVGSGLSGAPTSRAAMLLGSPMQNLRLPANGWSCSNRLRRASPGLPSFSTRQRRPTPGFTWLPSKPPPGPLQ